MYVRTIAGELYSCYWASPYDQQCWIAVAAVPDLPADRCWFTQAPPPDPPLGPVRAVKQFHYCSSFAGSTQYSVFNYYLLESGDVLQWGRNEFHLFNPPGANLLRLRIIAVSIATGGIGGGFGAIGLAVVRRWRAARPAKDRP